ncbi:unnamed protein product [Symbiodinium sp. CCMP2592]|nr:unnamed protein product [Symbiodinium sp. CCMP2592]
MPGYRPKSSGFVASARCTSWKTPDCEEAALGSYLDPTKDPPSELILTEDVRRLQDDLLLRFAEPPAEAPTWSRLRDQRKPPAEGSSPRGPGPIPSKLCPTRSGLEHAGEAFRNLASMTLCQDAGAGGTDEQPVEEEDEQKRQHMHQVMMQVFTWLQDDYCGTTCGRSRQAAYREGLGAKKRMQMKAALQLQPGLRNPQRRRGNAVPSTARVAAIAVLRQLFPEHRFEDREVRVEVARQLQTSDADFRFPRLEASIYGRGSPMSLCCGAAVLTFFDVICGVCVICLKSTCEAPALELQPLTEASRLKLWGHWISLSGGVLPKSRPPSPARTKFFPTSQAEDDWLPRASAMALLAEKEQRKPVHVDVELRQPQPTPDFDERSIAGSELVEATEALTQAQLSLEGLAVSTGPEVEGASAEESKERAGSSVQAGEDSLADPGSDPSFGPQPVFHRPAPSKEAWRAQPVTDGQASLLKSKLEELYMEQRFGKELYMEQRLGRLSLRANPSHENLTTQLAGSHRPFRANRAPRDGVAAATQTEDLFYLTSEDVALPDASPDAAMQHRPETARSSRSATVTRSSPTMSRPSSSPSRPRSAGPGMRLQPRPTRETRSSGRTSVDAAGVARPVTRTIFGRHLGQRWRVLPPKHVRPHHANLPSVLVMAKTQRQGR